jgi:hypothetical protein
VYLQRLPKSELKNTTHIAQRRHVPQSGLAKHEALRLVVMPEQSPQHHFRLGKINIGSHVSAAQKVPREAEHDERHEGHHLEHGHPLAASQRYAHTVS